jgi:hypothetical protein
MIRPELTNYQLLIKSADEILNILQDKIRGIDIQIQEISKRKGNTEQQAINLVKISNLKINRAKTVSSILQKKRSIEELKKRANYQEQFINKNIELADLEIDSLIEKLKTKNVNGNNVEIKKLILQQSNNIDNLNDYDYALFYLKIKNFIKALNN